MAVSALIKQSCWFNYSKIICSTFRKCSSLPGDLSYYHGLSSKPLIAATFPRIIERTYLLYGQNEAVVDCEQNIRKTYRQYIDDIEKLATGLVALGLKRGDRIGIFAPSCYQWLLVQFAAAISGLILVAINPTCKSKELEHCLKLTGVRTLVAAEKVKDDLLYPIIRKTVPEMAASGTRINDNKFPDLDSVIMISDQHYDGAWRFEDIASIEDADSTKILNMTKDSIQIHDPVYIIFTSGTTGLPKGCTLSQHSTINTSYFYGPKINFDKPGKVMCISSPLFHAMGIAPVLTCMIYGQKLVLPSQTYSVQKMMNALHQERCTLMTGTPTMYIDIMNNKDFDKYDFSALDKCSIGGASASPDTFSRIMEKFGVSDIMTGYGCSESTLLISRTSIGDPLHVVQSTVGKVQEHLEVKLVDQEGNLVKWGTPGELLVRGYNAMMGYCNDLEKTKQVFTENRFYKTGDLATLKPDGTVTIVGRIKDMILRGGENIYPKEIEDVIIMHPKLMEAHVFGIPNERLGEVVCAWVMAKHGEEVAAEEIISFCKTEMAAYKVPYQVRIVNSFPKLGSGKVNKTEMRKQMLKSDANK